MNLLPPLTPKTPHGCVQHVLFAKRMSNRPSAEKTKKSQILRKIISEFIQSESPFEPKVS